MKRFILAIAALGMIAPFAAQAASTTPVTQGSAVVQSQHAGAHKISAAKTAHGKSTAAHKHSKKLMKKSTAVQPAK